MTIPELVLELQKIVEKHGPASAEANLFYQRNSVNLDYKEALAPHVGFTDEKLGRIRDGIKRQKEIYDLCEKRVKDHEKDPDKKNKPLITEMPREEYEKRGLPFPSIKTRIEPPTTELIGKGGIEVPMKLDKLKATTSTHDLIKTQDQIKEAITRMLKAQEKRKEKRIQKEKTSLEGENQ